MITIDRLFHIDLTHTWNRNSGRYEPIVPARFDAAFSGPAELVAANLIAMVRDRSLFPKDEAYVADVARRHARSTLFVTLVTNTEDAFGEVELGQKRQTLPLTASAIAAIQALLPQRLACDIPVLAEVEIFLDGPHIK